MIVYFTSENPYIASRNNEHNGIVFEGTKKECEGYLLELFNKYDELYACSVGEAIRKSNKRGHYDGLFRDSGKGHRCYFRYDSRSWDIMHKKEAE